MGLSTTSFQRKKKDLYKIDSLIFLYNLNLVVIERWCLLSYLHPLLVVTDHSTFLSVVCNIYGGIPSYVTITTLLERFV